MYKNMRLVFVILLFSLSTLCPSYANTSEVSIEEEILAQVNSYRQQHHLSPLKMNRAMSMQAKIHSTNMAKHHLPFGHANFLKRVKALRKEIKNPGAAAENVAFNYKDAHHVVKNWLLSPGHKKNIVGNYNLTGIGIARDALGRIYFTQMFMKTTE